jgi:sialate O-acetylesterase
VYGPAFGAKSVTVTVSDGKSSYDVVAKVGKDATHQPYGYVDPGTGANLPVVSDTWKAVLHPTAAGGDYTITAKCTGCTNVTTATLSHVTFGDMWYCSGQSNMWLPVQFSFSRNKSVAAIAAGKYNNIRGMFSPSADTPQKGLWKTAQQAIQDGNETKPTYSFFNMGAACWYFAQNLVDRGVKTPIGIADTAIGGQRIEEFMNNKTYTGAVPCPDSINGTEVKTAWNGQLFAKQVMPFVDMTVKGWTWYQGENNMQNMKGILTILTIPTMHYTIKVRTTCRI